MRHEKTLKKWKQWVWRHQVAWVGGKKRRREKERQPSGASVSSVCVCVCFWYYNSDTTVVCGERREWKKKQQRWPLTPAETFKKPLFSLKPGAGGTQKIRDAILSTTSKIEYIYILVFCHWCIFFLHQLNSFLFAELTLNKNKKKKKWVVTGSVTQLFT